MSRELLTSHFHPSIVVHLLWSRLYPKLTFFRFLFFFCPQIVLVLDLYLSYVLVHFSPSRLKFQHEPARFWCSFVSRCHRCLMNLHVLLILQSTLTFILQPPFLPFFINLILSVLSHGAEELPLLFSFSLECHR